MKALVFHSPKKVTLEDVPDPKIEKSNDIFFKVTSTGIYGSDLHIHNRLIPQLRPMILVHEFKGEVEKVGPLIRHFKRSERVFVPFRKSCGQCFFSEHKLQNHYENSNPNHRPEAGLLLEKGGTILGYTNLIEGYNGGQAEYVSVPFANYGRRKVDEVVIDAVVMEAEKTFIDKAAQIVELEAGRLNELRMCVSGVRRGGTISVVGDYGTNYDNFQCGKLFDKGIKLIGGQAPVQTHIDHLMKLLKKKKVFLDNIFKHKFPLNKNVKRYQIFKNKADNCMKVTLKPHG